MKTVKTVSYTHLDVYKRQLHILSSSPNLSYWFSELPAHRTPEAK